MSDESAGRLSFRKFGEHQLRRDFKDQAIDKCRDKVNAFGKCAQEQGLMVVFRCQDFNKQLNACMAEHNSNEAFEKYKNEHTDKLIEKIPGLNAKK